MIFKPCKIEGVYRIEMEKIQDERGFFARSFCQEEFRERGLEFSCVQCNVSYNEKKGTLRGMHFQTAPFEEAKIVTCIKGSIYDVVIDLRRESNTYLQWESFVLNEKDRLSLYIPEGLAHGFQTLEDHTEVFYQMGQFYHPECSCGVRWNDKAFNISWPPAGHRIISEKDADFQDFLIG